MMTAIEHHPSDETVFSYVAGALPAALALVVGCHLQYCPRCSVLASRGEVLGGSLLASLEAKPLSAGRRESMMALLDTVPETVAPVAVECGVSELPSLLHSLLGYRDFDALPWKTLVPGMKQLKLGCGEGDAKLLRIAGGMKMPLHGHTGNEMALILRGGYRDSLGQFGVGDFAELDTSVEHQPVADADADCICLTGLDAPLKFNGLLAKVLQPFFGL